MVFTSDGDLKQCAVPYCKVHSTAPRRAALRCDRRSIAKCEISPTKRNTICNTLEKAITHPGAGKLGVWKLESALNLLLFVPTIAGRAVHMIHPPMLID